MRKKENTLLPKTSLVLLVFFALMLLIHCWPSRVSLPPLPSRIETLEGYASLKITGDQGSSRSRFSFLFHLPHQGRIEVFNFLGKTISQIIVDKEKALLIIPSKKVYWQGEEEEIIYKFLGFRLDLHEMICLFSGQWDERMEDKIVFWDLQRNDQGQVTAGRRGELRFRVTEFFVGSPVARQFVFHHPLNRGMLKILSINFNQPVPKNAYALSFLDRYERRDWAGIEKILADEN